MRLRSTICVAVMSLTACLHVVAAPPLTVNGAKPEHVRVSLAPVPKEQSLDPELPMIARINGTIDLTTVEVELLRKACKQFKGLDGSWDAATTLVYLTGETAKTAQAPASRAAFEIRRTDHATLLLRAVDGPNPPQTWTLDPMVAPLQMIELVGLAAPLQLTDTKLKSGIAEFDASPGAIRIDSALVKDRLYHGRVIAVPDTKRDLATGKVLMRLPKGFKPEMYHGVLLWIHSGDEAVLPESLYAAADELGLVLATQVDAGNGTPIVIRMQRVSDTLATVAERVLIDPERIYVGGISGGGKTSLMCAAMFPEVFPGALCIVGFGTYEKTENTGGVGFWPELFAKFGSDQWKRFKTSRLAAVTGDKDFNHGPILAAAKVYQRDQLTCRVFDIPGLAHEMPSSEQIQEQLRWIDEPRRQSRIAADAKGAELLKSANAGEAALRKVIEIAPFSESAWEAYRKLRK